MEAWTSAQGETQGQGTPRERRSSRDGEPTVDGGPAEAPLEGTLGRPPEDDPAATLGDDATLDSSWSAPPSGPTLDAPQGGGIGTWVGGGGGEGDFTPVDPPGYRIERELGRGGMGVVYLARQTHANRMVALKMVLGGRGRPEDVLRFRNEGESLARLHHPNIVQIYEVGVVDGRPFFSMEYVEGGTLAESIAAAPRSPEDAADLAETLARAVHAAHQCGVVHRDLKPANVLIAGPASGSSRPAGPKITDFGLAKQVGTDSGLTQTGQVLGTPSYMAPEQAKGGASVGVPADVHALGAILYELLAGRPPFRGATAWETVLQVVHGEAPPPSRWRRGVPRDLEVICLKCLAKDPAGRYASADALAEDLRRYRAGESILARPSSPARRAWLWCRRRPAVAALLLALAATAVLGGVGVVVQWRRAERHLLDADARLGLAMEAIERYYVGAGGDVLLKRPELAELRKSLLRAPLDFYRRLADDLQSGRGDDPGARAALGRSLLALADVTTQVGTTDEAVAAYRRAFDVGDRLAAEHPDDPEGLRIVVAGRIKLAPVLIEAGRTADARASLAAALDAANRLARDFPAEPRDVDDRASVLHFLGDMDCDAGDFEKSEADYRLAIDVREKVLADHPDSPEILDNLAGTRNNLGYMYAAYGRRDRALEAYRASLADRRRLCSQHPEDVGYRRRLTSSLHNVGGSLFDTGRTRDALPRFEEALAIQERLTRDHGAVPLYQHDLAATLMSLARCRAALGEDAPAEAATARAIAILDRIVAEHPEVLFYRASRYDAASQAATQAYQARRMGQALARQEEVVALGRDLLARDDAPLRRVRVAADEGLLGRILAEAGATDRARVLLRAAVATLDRLAAAQPDNLAAALERANVRLALGDVEAEAGRCDAAEPLIRAAAAEFERLSAAQPDDRQVPRGVADARRRLGDLLVRRSWADPEGDRARAGLAELDRALATAGRTLEARRDATSEEDVADVLASHARALAAQEPADLAAALADWDRAIGLAPARSREALALGRAEALARGGRVAEALQIADAARPTTPEDLAALARVYARSDAGRADRAIAALREAAARPESADGVRLAAALDDPAFAPLRHRPDFRALRAELAARTLPDDLFAAP
nr:serine/threonine-protein kinase [Paludisphaera mucosa]